MDCISNSIKTELCSDGLWSQVLGDLWIMGSAQLSEAVYSILLSYFESKNRPRGEVLNNWQVLWNDILVDTIEFLDHGS